MFHPLYKNVEISKVDLDYSSFDFNTMVLIRIIIIKACKGHDFFFKRRIALGGRGNDSCLPSGFSVVIY